MTHDPRRDDDTREVPAGPLTTLANEVAALRSLLVQVVARVERVEARLTTTAAIQRDTTARMQEISAALLARPSPGGRPSPYPRAAPSAELTQGGTHAIVERAELDALVKVYRRVKWWTAKGWDAAKWGGLQALKWGAAIAGGWFVRELVQFLSHHFH